MPRHLHLRATDQSEATPALRDTLTPQAALRSAKLVAALAMCSEAREELKHPAREASGCASHSCSKAQKLAFPLPYGAFFPIIGFTGSDPPRWTIRYGQPCRRGV